MALPQAASTSITQPCKNKYALSVIAQKIKEILNFMATVTFPIPIAKGGTGQITSPLARVSMSLITTDLGINTVINWAATTNFYNSIAVNKTYTMTNIADGLSIQLLIFNSSGGTITPTFPVAVKWVGGADPGTIAAGVYALYSFTSVNGNYIGVIGAGVV